MTKHSPDFQKRESKQSLWDMDGIHVNKRWRNKGKGRGKDKILIKQELKLVEQTKHDDDWKALTEDLEQESNNNLWYSWDEDCCPCCGR